MKIYMLRKTGTDLYRSRGGWSKKSPRIWYSLSPLMSHVTSFPDTYAETPAEIVTFELGEPTEVEGVEDRLTALQKRRAVREEKRRKRDLELEKERLKREQARIEARLATLD